MTGPVVVPTSPSITGESYEMQSMGGTPWEGLLVVEGVETGDGREFAPNSLTWAEMPIPLRRNIEDSHGGEPKTTAVLVGRIDQVWRNPDNPLEIYGRGVFDDAGVHGAEALRLVGAKFLKGISIDSDSTKNADVELVFADDTESFHGKHNQKSHGDRYLPSGKKATKKKPRQSVKWADDNDNDDDDVEDEEPIDDIMSLFSPPEKTIYHAGRLRAATLVDIPAFVEAQIWLVDPSTVPAVTAAAWSSQPWNGALNEGRIKDDHFAAIKSAYAYVPDVTHGRLDAKFLHHEIDLTGDVGPANLAACAAAVRFLTSDRASSMSLADRRHAYEHLVHHLTAAGKTVEEVLEATEAQSFVAALEQLEGPPPEWFAMPEPGTFQAPTISDEVTASGWRLFTGHGAAWGTCHIGFNGECKTPPREGQHDFFLTGEVACADGSRVSVGSITLGTGHASTIGTPMQAAVEHYDNTGTVVALVASSEGRHGIWLSGAIPPWVSADRVAQFQASGQVSGDWRRIGNRLRLVAFLAVNTPGFPVPRLRLGMQRGTQVSLVAAGLRPDPVYVAEQQQSLVHRIAKSIGRDSSSRAAEIRRRVKGV